MGGKMGREGYQGLQSQEVALNLVKRLGGEKVVLDRWEETTPFPRIVEFQNLRDYILILQTRNFKKIRNPAFPKFKSIRGLTESPSHLRPESGPSKHCLL